MLLGSRFTAARPLTAQAMNVAFIVDTAAGSKQRGALRAKKAERATWLEKAGNQRLLAALSLFAPLPVCAASIIQLQGRLAARVLNRPEHARLYRWHRALSVAAAVVFVAENYVTSWLELAHSLWHVLAVAAIACTAAMVPLNSLPNTHRI